MASFLILINVDYFLKIYMNQTKDQINFLKKQIKILTKKIASFKIVYSHFSAKSEIHALYEYSTSVFLSFITSAKSGVVGHSFTLHSKTFVCGVF